VGGSARYALIVNISDLFSLLIFLVFSFFFLFFGVSTRMSFAVLVGEQFSSVRLSVIYLGHDVHHRREEFSSYLLRGKRGRRARERSGGEEERGDGKGSVED
jgi:hypothetical protein